MSHQIDLDTSAGDGSDNRGADSARSTDNEVQGAYRFAWRRRIQHNPVLNQAYRVGVAVVGFIVTVGGLIMVPLAGPGWAAVLLGVAIWATEFEWAQRLLTWGKAKLKAWQEWLSRSPWWVSVLVAVGTCLCVVLAMWGALVVTGVPGFLPDSIEDLLHKVPGL